MARVPDTCERVATMSIPVGVSWLDSAQILSIMNRKLYRQGMQYAIADVEIINGSDTSSSVYVNRMCNNWVTANSWTKGYYHWKAQQDEAMREAGNSSTIGTYRDFKIFMNVEHANADSDEVLDNAMGWITPAAAKLVDSESQYDWEYSQVVVPNDGGTAGNSVEYYLHMNGPDAPSTAPNQSKGLIEAYAESRSRPQATDPNVIDQPSGVEGGLYSEMEDLGEIQDDVVVNARYTNDQPPYVIGNSSQYGWYPYGANMGAGTDRSHVQDILTLRSGSSSLAMDNTGGFLAPCGLIQFTNFGDDVLTLRVTWVAGDYQGVAARPMKEMN